LSLASTQFKGLVKGIENHELIPMRKKASS